jgi:hypothetical protein
MAHISRCRGASPAAPGASPRSLSTTPLLGDRSRLTAALATKRAAVAELEAAWVAAAEAAIIRHIGGSVRIDDRATWDKATWLRYLAAAEQQEPEFKPRLKRLLTEIDSLEKLLSMPPEHTQAASRVPERAPA